jgi:hypothetical protein
MLFCTKIVLIYNIQKMELGTLGICRKGCEKCNSLMEAKLSFQKIPYYTSYQKQQRSNLGLKEL